MLISCHLIFSIHDGLTTLSLLLIDIVCGISLLLCCGDAIDTGEAEMRLRFTLFTFWMALLTVAVPIPDYGLSPAAAAGLSSRTLISQIQLPLPRVQNKPNKAQGSLGKWPGGNKAPSFIATLFVIGLLAAAVVAFVIYAGRQKKAEREAAEKLRRRRESDDK